MNSLNTSSRLLHYTPLDDVWDTGSIAPLFIPSSGPSNLVPFYTRPSIYESPNMTSYISKYPLNSEPMTCDQLDEVKNNSPTSFLPRWDAKTIEAAIDDVGYASYG